MVIEARVEQAKQSTEIVCQTTLAARSGLNYFTLLFQALNPFRCEINRFKPGEMFRWN